MGYDNRMGVVDNWRFGVWRPALCRFLGHKITCYGITPSRGVISGYVYICRRCTEMVDHDAPCGQCSNMCRERDED